jgi:hypothetical protein
LVSRKGENISIRRIERLADRLIFGIDYTGLYPKSLHDKFNLLNGADSGQ